MQPKKSIKVANKSFFTLNQLSMTLAKLYKAPFKLVQFGIVVSFFLLYVLLRQKSDQHHHTRITWDLDGYNLIGKRATLLERKNVDYDQQEMDYFWKTQNITSTDGEMYTIYMLHSYYDDRPLIGAQRFIRIFIITPKQAYETLKANIFCHLWKSWKWSKREVFQTVTAKTQNVDGARRLAVNHTIYWNVVISCPVSTIKDKISYVSISQSPHVIPDVYLNMTYPKHPSTFEHRYGMCQSNGVLYGWIPDNQAGWLIEWFELNQILGITEFNLYNSTVEVGGGVSSVLKYYKQRELLKVHHIPPPFTEYSKKDQNTSEIPMKLALNDCLYRNMYRYEYIVVIDIDEVIVPQLHDNYDNLLEYLEPNIKLLPNGESPSLSFGSYAFYKTYPKSSKLSLQTDLQTTLYTYYNDQAFKKKTIFNPRHCLSGFSHFCLKPLVRKPLLRRMFHTEDTAAVHHYRKECVSSTNQKLYNSTMCDKYELEKKVNTRMHRFREALSQRVRKVKDELNIH